MARRRPPPPPPTYSYSTELYGGLGDIFWGIFCTDRYVRLDELRDDEGAAVSVVSHNPHAVELVRWHTKASQLTIFTPRFQAPWKPHHREGLPPLSRHRIRGYKTVRFYPSPWDANPLADLSNIGPYILFNLSAGDAHRSIPLPAAQSMARLAKKKGYSVVVIGRDYTRMIPRTPDKHRETRLVGVDGAMNLIDKLTVPGTTEAVKMADGVVCPHSALCLLSWFMRRPNYVLWPPKSRRDFTANKITSYGFGARYPESRNSAIEEYTERSFEEFLEMLTWERKRVRQDPVEYLMFGGPLPK